MTRFLRLCLPLLLALVGLASEAQEVELHVDRESWASAARGQVVQEHFDQAALGNGLSIVEVGSGHGWGVWGGAYDDRVVGDSSYTVFSFATAVTGFGATWDLSPAGLGQGLLLLVNGLAVSREIPNDIAGGFFGVTSATPFDSVVIFGGSQGGIAESYRMDDLVFALPGDGVFDPVLPPPDIGTPTAPVPEPQTYLLMLLGLVAIGFVVSGRLK
jgi:hypothetical protein